MIKQIQLRGISRTPSDRASMDGGCAESLNVQIEGNEIAPAPRPRNAMNLLGGGDYIYGDVVYIHKTSASENFIVLLNNALYAYINGVRTTVVPEGIMSGFKGITSVGNVLVITVTTSTGDECIYSIYKDGAYTPLTGGVPVPYIEFRVDLDNSRAYTYSHQITGWSKDVSGGGSLNAVEKFQTDVWNVVPTMYPGSMSDTQKEQYAEILDIINQSWGAVETAADNHLSSKLFTYPRLVRYAVRLYDGTYVNVSAPVYLGAGYVDAIKMTGSWYGSVSTLTVELNTVYKAVAQLKGWNPGPWAELIESIDIFLSPAIPFPKINAKAIGINNSGVIQFEGQETDGKAKAWEENLLSATNFYKIASFGMDDLSDLEAATGYNLLEDPTLGRDENLVSQPRLDALSQRRYVPDKVITYNRRVIGSGGKLVLPRGYGFFFAPSAGDYTGFLKTAQRESSSFRVRYYCRDSVTGETKVVMGRTYDGSLDIPSYEVDWSDGYGIFTKVALPYGVLFYDDPSCYKVEFEIDGDGWNSFEMKEHPMLNCSYCIFGADTALDAFGPGTIDTDEDGALDRKESLIISEADDPFNFLSASGVRFSDPITSVATTTKALSEGQFGAFPLYVFTSGGIYSVGIAADGTLSSSHPLSLETAKAGSICPIDQAIVFATDNGVKLLQQSDIVELAPYMNGAVFIIPSDLQSVLNSGGYGAYVSAMCDGTTFMEFMDGAKCAYDYSGKRLVFFKDDKTYQYIYMFETQSWHKMLSGNYSWSEHVYHPLQSNPGCLVSYKSHQHLTRLIITEVHDSIERQRVNEILAEYEIDTTGLPAQLPAVYEFEMDGTTIEELETDLNNSGCVYSDYTFSTYRTVLYDYATKLDQAALVPSELNPIAREPGVIVTRPLSFDADDVRKTITQLRIRGRFRNNAEVHGVRYLLLVSMDGITWQLLRTLRGGSYKLFRLVILTNLHPTERISWVEVDVEGRYANKLR